MTTGPDTSNWQPGVNWGQVREAGHSFAFFKATEGTGYVDPTFAPNRAGTEAAGFVLRGMYHFCHPHKASPEAEAQHFLNVVGDHQPGEVACLDVEAPGEIDGNAGPWCARWCDIVEAAGWPPVVIYGNGGDVSALGDSCVSRPLWVAGYPRFTTIGAWPTYAFHQFADNYDTPGIGPCDMSRSPLDESALAALGGSAPTPIPEDDDMAALFTFLYGPSMWVTNGMELRRVETPAELDALHNAGVKDQVMVDDLWHSILGNMTAEAQRVVTEFLAAHPAA